MKLDTGVVRGPNICGLESGLGPEKQEQGCPAPKGRRYKVGVAFSIRRIETRIVTHPLRTGRVILSHAGAHACSRFLVAIVEGGNEARGFGEAATTPNWSGETAETAQWIVDKLFAPRLVGNTFDHPREAFAIMDSAIVGNPFAKGALDTAMWDLWARTEGVPATRLFADRDPVPWLPTRASVGAYPVEKTVQLAREFWQLGVKVLKFKIGAFGLDDAARLRAVREELSNAPVFTVDANGAYKTADQAVVAIEALLPFGLALVEQPTPRGRMRLMAEVRRRIPVPILADESVFSPFDLAEALDCDAFDILSVYPGKNGGFTCALGLAKTAREAGKRCAIGSNLETDLGQAAMACLAAGLSAFPVEEIPGDLAANLFYENSSVKQPLALQDGRLRVPEGLGFGVEPVEPAL